MTDHNADSFRNEIVARAGSYYRNARYLIVAMCFGAGLWFAYDGWVAWPAQRAQYEALPAEKQASAHAPHGDLDILLQKVLASVLVPLAPAFLIFTLYRSRGTYRLTPDDTLHVPGHPPVDAAHLLSIDKTLWERKGIAYVDYQIEGGAKGRLKLDDFVYQQAPTDQIVKRLDAYFEPEIAEGEAAASEEPEAIHTESQQDSDKIPQE